VTSNESRVVAVRVARLDEAAAWAEFLTVSEGEKAERMASDILRARYVIGRGLRRQLLAECTGRGAGELEFVEDSESKPRLVDADGWDFNVSHAGDYVVVAVRRGAVGVDLEMKRPVREMGALVRRYFHADEAAAWEGLEEPEKEGGFFTLWSAREAAMKCCGLGLAKGLTVTRVDPAILQGDEVEASVAGVTVGVRRHEAPPGYVMMLART
jgi:4'-phosphopantetheinyl transferase